MKTNYKQLARLTVINLLKELTIIDTEKLFINMSYLNYKKDNIDWIFVADNDEEAKIAVIDFMICNKKLIK